MKYKTKFKIGYKNLGLIGRIVFWIAIIALVIGIAFGLHTVLKGGTKDNQEKILKAVTTTEKPKQKPILKYSISSLLSNYAYGLEVMGIKWQNNYREYLLTIRNEDKNTEIVNLRTNLDLIGGLVTKEIIFQEGCENVSLSNVGFHGVGTGDKGKITQTINHYTNNLNINVIKLFPEASLKLKLIVSHIPDTYKKGYLEIEFSYPATQKEIKKVSEVYPVFYKSNDRILSIDFDNPVPVGSKYKKSIIMMFAPPKEK